MRIHHPVLRRLSMQLVWGVLVIAMLSVQGAGGAEVEVEIAAPQGLHKLDIDAGTLHAALLQLAQQSGVQLVHFSDTISHALRAGSLRGAYTLEEALALLLKGTGLTYRFVNGRTVAVVQAASAASSDDAAITFSPSIKQSNAPIPRTPVRRWIARLAAFLTACGAMPGVVCAEESAAASLEEVVVTARKREESLQETPVAVTAIGAESLEQNRIVDFMDLHNMAPSVHIAPYTGNRAGPNLFIRGMGALATQITKDYATAIYIDDVPVGRGNALGTEIADLERIEILRGPQGASYGRNTTAGAVKFITAKPENDFSFEQKLDLGNYDRFASRTRVNVPVTDRLYTRIVYARASKDGWVKNANEVLPNQIDFNADDDSEALRWSTRLRATDNLTVDYSLDRSTLIYGNVFFQVVSAFSGRQEETSAPLGLSPSRADVKGHNLTATWDLGSAEIKSVTGYREMDSEVYQTYIDAFKQHNLTDQHQASQELQIVGDMARVKYVAGLFYFKEAGTERMLSTFAPTLFDSWAVKASSESEAVYGQATWTPAILNDQLDLTVGARYTRDTRKATKTFIQSGFLPGANGTVVHGDRSFSEVTPTFTAQYSFSDAVNGYATVAKGYRAGGFNTQSTVVGFARGFDPEEVVSYELGVKSELLDRRLRLNVAAFLNKYSDIQVDQQRTPTIFTDTLNAAKSEVKGFELEASAVLTHGLSANLFYSYMDGKFDTYLDNGVDYAAIKTMPRLPKGQGGVGLTYSLQVPDYGELVCNLDYKWQREQFTGVDRWTLTPGYHLWNASVQLPVTQVGDRGELRLVAWGKNIADEKYRYATNNLGRISTQYGEPRTMGLSLIFEY